MIFSRKWKPFCSTLLTPSNSLIFNLLDIFFKRFIYLFQRECPPACEWGEGQREGDKQTPHWVWSPMWGSIPGPWDHDLSWNQELDAQLTEWATPVSPCRYFLKTISMYSIYLHIYLFTYNYFYLFDSTSRGSGRQGEKEKQAPC